MDLELRLRDALVLEDTSKDFIARVMARVDNPQVIDIRTRRRSRFVVSGTLAVVGIAAAMFIWSVSGPEPGPVGAPLPPDDVGHDEKAAPAATLALIPAASGPAPEISLPPAEPEAEQVAPSVANLPLVPPPASRPPNVVKSSLALQKAVERHPELVHGPQLDDTSTFLVSVAMRTDGAVLNSAAELASPATFPEIAGRLSRTLPLNAGEDLTSMFVKGQQVADGRALRARVFMRAVLISDIFDLGRSDVRAREILGHKYDDLMTAPGSDERNMLTVFLSDDGSILREKVERVTMQNEAVVLGLGTGARQEETIAAKLGIDVEQIGQIGTTTLEQGSPREGVDPYGAKRLEGIRMLSVRYAWERRPEEPAAIHTPRRAAEPEADFDLAAALVVAERLLPDAFSHAPPSLADRVQHTVVFTAQGEVMRAGRVQLRDGVSSDSLLQEQLVPGVRTGLHRTVMLTNKTGATARVMFAWAE